MKTNSIFALLLGSVAFAFPAFANTTIVAVSAGCEQGKTTTQFFSDTSFYFSLGSFKADPSRLSLANWKTSFNDLADGVWVNDTGDSGIPGTGFYAISYAGDYTVSGRPTGVATGQQAYIWGYNTQTIGAGTEWLLLTNPSWTFPDPAAVPPINWLPNSADAGTYAVFGFLGQPSSGAEPYLQAMAVPEPSIAGALLGGVASLLALSRFRHSFRA